MELMFRRSLTFTFALFSLFANTALSAKTDQQQSSKSKQDESAASKPDKQTLKLLGESYFENKQYRAAIVTFNKLLKLDPTTAWPRWYIGRAYEALHHNREALYFYLEAMRVGPADDTWDADHRATVVSNAGSAIVGLSKETTLELALPSFQERIEHMPRSAWARSMLGQLYSAYGRDQEAYDALSEALRLAPDDPSWDKNQEAYTRSVLARLAKTEQK